METVTLDETGRGRLPLNPAGEAMVAAAYDMAARYGEVPDDVNTWYRAKYGRFPTRLERQALWERHVSDPPELDEETREQAERALAFRRMESQRKRVEEDVLAEMGAILASSQTPDEADERLAPLEARLGDMETARMMAVLSFPADMRRLMGLPSDADLMEAVTGTPSEMGPRALGKMLAPRVDFGLHEIHNLRATIVAAFPAKRRN